MHMYLCVEELGLSRYYERTSVYVSLCMCVCVCDGISARMGR